ncbi:hypothetical protein [Limnohabitans sp.]|uniref:hypothetical protein n=1 Tax=Limnohabitans sp. TaxID=1907725 RepID=UPI0037BF1C7A
MADTSAQAHGGRTLMERPGLTWPALGNSTDKATTAAPGPVYAKRLPNTWNAASLPTALREPAALAAGQTAGAGMGTAQPAPGGVPAALEAMGVATFGAPSQPVQPKRSAHPNGQRGKLALFQLDNRTGVL